MSIFIKKTMRRLFMPLTVIAALAAGSSTSFAQEPPAAGKSPRIDAIKSAGVLRVAVLSNAPWLIENTSGTGEAWDGPAWILAKEYARIQQMRISAFKAFVKDVQTGVYPSEQYLVKAPEAEMKAFARKLKGK